MSAPLPIIFTERAVLPQLGINPEHIKFGDLTLESDSFVLVREKQPDGKSALTIVDMTQGNQVQRRPIAAEAAIMNPTSQVIALRGGQNLQIFDIQAKQKLKSHKLGDDEKVAFWRWISPNTIAIVTSTSVFHWDMQGGSSSPVHVFDRHASLANCQIINYRASPDGKWLLVVGIAQGANQSIDGFMQLYSTAKQVSQPLQGHAGCFTLIKVGSEPTPRQVFCFVEKKAGQGPKLYVMEVGKDKDAPGGVFKIAPQDVPFPPDAATDFPVSLMPSAKHGILYLITKFGFLYLFDAHTGTTLYRNRISGDTIFVTCSSNNNTGIMGVTARKGQVLQITINEQQLIPYLLSLGNQNQIAIALASRLGLPGAENMYSQEFNRLFSAGDYKGAAKLAADSPAGALRTQETIQRFQQLPAQPGQPSPVLQYFSTLLEKGKLNKVESVELARPVLQQGRQQMLEQWLKEDKLECSEELGDIVVQHDAKMALSVYLRANVPEKVVNCFVHTGDYANIVAYTNKVGYRPDYVIMLQNLVRQNPKSAEDFAKMLVNGGPPGPDGQPPASAQPMVDVNTVVDIFMQLNRIQETTSFLLEALKHNRKEEGHLQTRLFEINLLGGAPQVADAIFASEMFSHYDRQKIAQLCEKAGLYQRALEHYTNIEDIKRIMAFAQAINPEFLVNFFGTMTADNCLECLNVLMTQNVKMNLQIVVQVATKYSEQLTPEELIALFEKYRSYDGLYYYLGAVLNFSDNKLVPFKYIEAATKMGQIDTVIKVCRESSAYDPVQVKDFLLNEKLSDPRPLIHVCDRYEYIDELTTFLYNNKFQKHIEVYVQKVSPQKTPMVVGRLLDLDCDEEFIKRLLDSVRAQCPVDPLVEEVEKRNRLRMLQPWLEQRIAEGNTEPATHNAIAKIFVTINKDPQQFLLNNQFYDSKVVGKFCEKLDPYLAFLAYKRAWGACDEELLEVTGKNELFKDQARYLVERQDQKLWERVLAEENPHRRRVIDETVQTALPESQNPDEVSSTVKAFIAAELPSELIELLEKIVLHGSDFSNNKNLQNLLILTALRAEPSRVMDYIQRLDNYDAADIAKIACSDKHKLFEEAFEVYKKHSLNVDAVDVLLNHIEDIDRGMEFAERVDEPAVWSRLAKAQLDANDVHEAIDSYLRAEDPEAYREVIAAANREEQWDDLARFLIMARKKVKESVVDSELIFAYARTKRLGDLQEFVASPNVAVIQDIGDRCFDEGMFEAAEILFKSISNNAKLAATYVHLNQFREAVECARKAGAVKTWKEVNRACVEAGEFRLAAICGLHIIKSPDHIEDLVGFYERKGHFGELIELFEQGLSLDGAHKALFTELGVLYSKYKPEKLMEHVKVYSSRMVFSKILRACEAGRHWKEAEHLYEENEEWDAAVKCMMEHPESCFEHDRFLDCISAFLLLFLCCFCAHRRGKLTCSPAPTLPPDNRTRSHHSQGAVSGALLQGSGLLPQGAAHEAGQAPAGAHSQARSLASRAASAPRGPQSRSSCPTSRACSRRTLPP